MSSVENPKKRSLVPVELSDVGPNEIKFAKPKTQVSIGSYLSKPVTPNFGVGPEFRRSYAPPRWFAV